MLVSQQGVIAMDEPSAALSQAELLRVLGQELDRDRAELRQIKYDGQGYHVFAMMHGAEVYHYFAPSEVEALSQRRRAERRVAALPRQRTAWIFGRHSAAAL